MSLFRRLLKAAVLLGAVRAARPREERRRIVPEGEPDPNAETAVILLLVAAAAAAAIFVVAYALDWSNLTQWLGLALGVSLGLIGVALIVISKRLVVTEELEHDYPEPEDAEEEQQLLQVVHESGSRFTRKRLLAATAGMAGAALGAALIVPAASLGPVLDTASLYETPWRRGRRLVDEQGRPYRATDIDVKDFYTAYPEDADREQLGAPIVVVRLALSQLRLPPERSGWAPSGIVAYSKICTHAGCAISLYRAPKFAPADPRPALVCPCHYSTFDPAAAGRVEFGPAGRNLPQLPLLIDSEGTLRAAGNLSAPVGPSFWGVRTRGPAST